MVLNQKEKSNQNTMKKIVFSLTFIISALLIQASNNPSFEVKVTGKGKPVILIPGYSCSGEVWNETVEKFKGSFEFHVITIAGFAGVKAIENENILETVKNDIAKYVTDKKLDKPMLIGHSLGAFMTLWLQADYPNLFDKGVCVDGVPFISALGNPEVKAEDLKNNPMYNKQAVLENFKNIPTDNYVENMAKGLKSQVESDERARTIATWGFNSDKATLGSTIIEMSLTDLRDKVAAIKQPMLILISGFGRDEASMKIFKDQFDKIPNKEFAIEPNAKHFIMYDSPEWFYTQIGVFLNAK